VTGFSSHVRATIHERAQGWCERCGGERGWEIHHRRPRGAGGTRRPETNLPSNGLLLCAASHRRIESQRAEAYEHGWLVHQTSDPREIPVLYRGTWVLLDDRGCMHDNPQHTEATS
jgi:5-methylcytosine-specific restriction protein A